MKPREQVSSLLFLRLVPCVDTLSLPSHARTMLRTKRLTGELTFDIGDVVLLPISQSMHCLRSPSLSLFRWLRGEGVAKVKEFCRELGNYPCLLLTCYHSR